MSVCCICVYGRMISVTCRFVVFSYDRFEVVAVFASTMLAQLGSLFIIKERCTCNGHCFLIFTYFFVIFNFLPPNILHLWRKLDQYGLVRFIYVIFLFIYGNADMN